MGASHKVVHAVLKDRHVSFFVNEVEVYKLVHRDLDPIVSLDEENEAIMVQAVVLLPLNPLFSVLIVIDIVHFDLSKEEDLVLSPCDNHLFINKVHLTEVSARDLLEFMGVELFSVVRVNVHCDRLALSVETVHFLTFAVIKALVWEVQPRWFNSYSFCHIYNLFLLIVIDQMVMIQVSVMEQVYENMVFPDETGVDERIMETKVGPRPLIDFENFRYIYFL